MSFMVRERFCVYMESNPFTIELLSSSAAPTILLTEKRD